MKESQTPLTRAEIERYRDSVTDPIGADGHVIRDLATTALWLMDESYNHATWRGVYRIEAARYKQERDTAEARICALGGGSMNEAGTQQVLLNYNPDDPPPSVGDVVRARRYTQHETHPCVTCGAPTYHSGSEDILVKITSVVDTNEEPGWLATWEEVRQ